MKKKTSRNGLIEIARFFAAVFMALYHFEWVFLKKTIYFTHLYILVEFFFVISGFFIVINSSKKSESSYKYVFKQLKKLYPMYLMSFCFCFIIYILNNHISLTNIPILLWNAKWEILLCNLFIISSTTIYNSGGAATFIPALLFTTLIMHYIYNNYRKIAVNIIIPIIIVCGIGRIFFVASNMSQWLKFDNIVTLGIIRAIVDISIGILFADKVYPYLKSKSRTFNYILLIISLIFIPLLVFFRQYISYSDLVLWIFIFGLFITEAFILYKGKHKKINNVLVSLGSLSFPIFMFHYGLIELLIYLDLDLKTKYIISIFIISIILVAIFVLMINSIFAKLKNNMTFHLNKKVID